MEAVKLSKKWVTDKCNIKYIFNGTVVFKDTKEHWETGVCRLIGLSSNNAKKWVECIALESMKHYDMPLSSLPLPKKIEMMQIGTSRFFNGKECSKKLIDRYLTCKISPCGHQPDIVWEGKIANLDSYSVIGCTCCQHGWIFSSGDMKNTTSQLTIYDEKYFEGTELGLGYGNCLAQMPWRMEKSRRFVRQIDGLRIYLGLKVNSNPFVLDIGSGYGFFRKALDERGWFHEGVELSKYAATVCKTEFNFDTFTGTLEDYSQKRNKKFDIITMWDILEHVDNPRSMLLNVKHHLSENGICVIRTPNLMALERDILKGHYYSLKKEHLQYFSPKSLSIFLERAGLLPVFLTTEAHFFRGFLLQQQHICERLLKGSDIIAVAINDTLTRDEFND